MNTQYRCAYACAIGDLEYLQLQLPDLHIYLYRFEHLVLSAVKYDQMHIILYLIEKEYATWQQVLQCACRLDKIEYIELALSHDKIETYWPLRMAMSNHNLKLFLRIFDKKHDINHLFSYACDKYSKNGPEIVDFLIPYVPVNYYALTCACDTCDMKYIHYYEERLTRRQIIRAINAYVPYKDITIFKYLYEKYGGMQEHHFLRCIECACNWGNWVLFQYLTTLPHYAKCFYKFGWTKLIKNAAGGDSVELVQFLIDNTPYQDELTMYAMRDCASVGSPNKNIEMVKFWIQYMKKREFPGLIEHGMDDIFQYGTIAIVKLIFESYGMPKFRAQDYERYIRLAADANKLDLVKYLMCYHIGLPTYYNNLPAISIPVLKYLLKKGLDKQLGLHQVEGLLDYGVELDGPDYERPKARWKAARAELHNSLHQILGHFIISPIINIVFEYCPSAIDIYETNTYNF